MRATTRILLALFVAAASLGTASAAAQDAKKLTLTVGLTQDVDSMNVTVGVLVPDFEVWNLQYATLTDKAAKDFGTIPGLAEEWSGSEDGLTWTYKLREGLTWSDGTPLTAEDIAYTINRSREEEWLNHSATVANLKAEVVDPRTVRLVSSVPDPKLPTMDVYIVPKHVYEKLDAKEISKYRALDGVGSGPFTLDKWEKGQFWRLKRNPRYFGQKPVIDEIVYRVFRNPDAMVAALKRGELDAAHNIPAQSYKSLDSDPKIVAVQGQQGGFDELALNGGDGLKKPHPALLDLKVRQAIAHAIDKATIVERVLVGLGAPADGLSPSANPAWVPDIPESERYAFDLDRAKEILEQAGYKDTNGNGIRELPGGGQELRFRYAIRTESDVAKPIAEFVQGWLRQIGIATTLKPYDDGQLTEVIGKGDYDLFVWGWTPYVDPDPMLSYFTCGQVSSDPENPTNYYNDANKCDPEYDRLYKAQNVELDADRRRELVHEMLTRFYKDAVYQVLYLSPDLQAYRTDRFTGWTKQPAEVGPVLFSNTSPTYVRLRPVAAATGSGDGGGLSAGAIVGIVVAVVAALGLGGFVLMRRRTVGERE